MTTDLPDSVHGDVLGHDAVAAALRSQQHELTARLKSLEADLEWMVAASADSNADDEHDPEGHTIAYERAQFSALILAVRDQLADTAATVARLEQGMYGICEVCGTRIPAERLAARPTARACVHNAAGR